MKVFLAHVVLSALILPFAFASSGEVRAQSTPDDQSPATGEQQPAQQPGTVPRDMRERLQKPRHLPQPALETTAPQPSGEAAPLPGHIRSQVMADVSQRAGVRAEAVVVVESVAVTWPDGSLGCPERGVDYQQLPLAGYRVVVRANDKTYDYRIATRPGAAVNGKDTGATAMQMRLCDSGLDPAVLDRAK